MARRQRETPDDLDPTRVAARQMAQELIEAHGGDPIAAWQALNAPGGMMEQIRTANAANAGKGSAFGLFNPSAALDDPAVGLGREIGEPPPFRVGEPPEQPITLRVRVDIDDAKPPIWRRLELAGDLTLEQLHVVVQSAFGWVGYHLHSFAPQVGGTVDRRRRPFPNEGTEEFCDERLPPESEVRLDQVLRAEGDRLIYEYDFGDSWEHTIRVEKVLPRGEGDPRARCVAGRRAGPPEDVGGIWRYNDLVASWDSFGEENPTPPELGEDELLELREWVGIEFDPADAELEGLDLDQMLGLVERAMESGKLLVDNPRLAPAFTELVQGAARAGALPLISPSVALSGLDLAAEPVGAARAGVFAGLTPQEAAAVTEPWQHLLRFLGPQGVELTAAGNLRPAVVESMVTEFQLSTEWAGRGYREDQTPSVAGLRKAATSLGLVRKVKGRLLPTKAAISATEPVRMWRMVADRLTRGREEFERQAAVIALLVAADRSLEVSALEVFRILAPQVLGAVGWRVGGDAPSAWHVVHASEVVWAVLEFSGCLDADGHVSEAGGRLAQAALLAP
ncbi:hypothetical protein BJY21_001738 [Kineosphaera limosa]|uniref:Plasmid pRiA4b Orf3-like domain-containing protein n=1 Tax=Kineosphaera limosa NBRC 100340 TaxID=1184609 RepID=K6W709_9MICO|nr:plasmid pRiA4b ORF-3 family protein [Kineosphaera limosa]NYE00554.1 hypothetical protein [Kineosphaera limosa]GAB94980.1 hypothetical protein KILIM_015_00400 [Kineosphaera limosa NBRC 100340]